MTEGIDVSELVKYLESGDLEVVDKFKQVVHENLHASKDASLLNALIDSYIQTKSNNLLEVLAGVNESHCQYLFDRMNELLKGCMYIETTSLLAAIIRRQPSWLYKIVGSIFFTQYLKCLKAETEVVFVMSGSIIISMLLPCVPSLVAPHLGDILEIFIHMASFIVNKPGFLPEVLILHLQIGVYILFQRLYSMYPNNFLSYMKSCFGCKPANPVFRQVIEPMLQFVKFHSGLILDTLKSESETVKWKTSQPHDIYAECQKISLDPLDAIKEATYTVFSQNATEGLHPKKEIGGATVVTTNSTGIETRKCCAQRDCTRDEVHNTNQTTNDQFIPYLSSQDLSSLWSPSFLCGLSTPPSSRPISPANSTQDILSLSEFAQRPMTPVCGVDTKDLMNSSEDTYTSTPIVTRRRSGGDLKKAPRKSFPASNLNLKSKSADSVEVENSNTEKEGMINDPDHRATYITPTRTSPKTKKDFVQEKRKNLVQVSPRLARSELSGYSRAAESASAPCTPSIVSKDSFSFAGSQPGNNDQASAVSKPAGTFPNSKVSRSAKRTSGTYKSDSLLTGLSVNLLRVIQDLHEEAITKQTRSQSQAMDSVEESDHFVKSKLKSPFELLDEFIDCGSSLHSLQLSRIPITSQMDTDWTYFGGFTPADELSILRAQVNLFEVQLQYERQKCDQHVFRNRRLVGKVHKALTVENELTALKKTVLLLEADAGEANIAIKNKDDEINRLREFNSLLEKDKANSLQTYSEENQSLKYQIEELSAEIKKQGNDRSRLEKNFIELQRELFNTKLEIDFLKPKLEINSTVQARAENLAKELAVFQERNEKLKRHVKMLNSNDGKQDETSLETGALRNELKDYRSCREALLTSIDAAKLKITDLEATLVKKEMAIRDQKTNIESLCRKHEIDIKVLEERYKCLKKATQGMESYILYLLKKVEDSGRSLHGRGRNSERRKGANLTANHDLQSGADLEEPNTQKTEQGFPETKIKQCEKPVEDCIEHKVTTCFNHETFNTIEIDKKLVDDSGIESIEAD